MTERFENLRPIESPATRVHPRDIDSMIDTVQILFEGLGLRERALPRDLVGC